MTTNRSPRPADVGTVGKLRLEYARRNGRTIIARSHCTSPWHLFPPIYLDDSGAAYTLLLNPSGGLVGGDRLSIDMTLGPQSHVLISTPSANRVYRSLGDEAEQKVRLSVASGAVLEWFPEVTIPFAGSRFVQTVDVTLAEGATALIWDSLASGRIARGERWAFASLQNEIRITTASEERLLERYGITPTQGEVGLVSEYDYVASLFVVGDAVERAKWAALRAALAEILDSLGGDVLGGVTEPPVPGLAVKLVARSAQTLLCMQESLWDRIRRDLLGLMRPVLRRY